VEQRAAFAQVAESLPDERYRSLMASAMFPWLVSNTGVLEAYENIEVRRGDVRLPDDHGYRGELYLQNGHGSVEITHWTMSRVGVNVEAAGADVLVLNQNFYDGWYCERRDAEGRTDVVAAYRSDGGLVAVPVSPHHKSVVLFYRPRSFVIGAWVSGFAVAVALGGLLWRAS
jgi:hypothetical protein